MHGGLHLEGKFTPFHSLGFSHLRFGDKHNLLLKQDTCNNCQHTICKIN